MNPQVELRPPSTVMRLSRMGSFHQSRLSFMRVLIRRMANESWKFDVPDWHIDKTGQGYAVYTVHTGKRSYSLVAFANNLEDDLRSDRVIAEAWDATYTLHDGIPSKGDIDRLAKNVPGQEAGRVSKKELTLSRSNKSMRMWNYVLGELKEGRQPEVEKIREVGYLMRTTAVYGSGKFGAADRIDILDRDELRDPFQVEMITVYLIRMFVLDLMDHMARSEGGCSAARLGKEQRLILGIGNSTGLGMAPFLVHHPALLNSWMVARETALARVRAVNTANLEKVKEMKCHLKAALDNAIEWKSEHHIQKAKLPVLRKDLQSILKNFDALAAEEHPWDKLFLWTESNCGEDAQEQLVSVLLEPYGELVDGLACCMYVDENKEFPIDASGTTLELSKAIKSNFKWALCDYEAPDNQARFWYVSEAKLEPRLGERFEEEGCELEQPLAIGRDIAALYTDLSENIPLAEFLMKHPEHRHIVRRIQTAIKYPYSEIQDNLIHCEMLPIDMLRCKLSFFGATKFDPRSDRWVRITMFQNAPFPEDFSTSEHWSYANAI